MDKNCARCGQSLPLDQFYFVSKRLGTRRGQCKECMRELKALQRDPNWKPTCARCGQERERAGPGRRLCVECFDSIYDSEERDNGSHRLRLSPCRACGAKRLRGDHTKNTALCPVCRSVPQGRRSRLARNFNLNPREFVQLNEEQGWRCAICGTKPRKSMHLDHQHGEPSILRGLTCGRCNTLLGMARDKADVLRAAAAYLDAPPAQRLFPGRVANEIANRYRPMTRRR